MNIFPHFYGHEAIGILYDIVDKFLVGVRFCYSTKLVVKICLFAE